MKTLLVGIVLAAGLLGTQIDWWSLFQQSAPPPPHQPGTVRSRIAANGIVEGARPEIAMRFETAGRLVALAVRENAEVKCGSVLAELENSSQNQEVALETAELARARADLDKLRNGERPEKKRAAKAVEQSKHALFLDAQATFERSERIHGRNALSDEEWDRTRNRFKETAADWEQAKEELALAEAPPRVEDVAAAEARVAAAEARLHQARAGLAKTCLRAPCNGRILQVFTEPGEMAGPASAQPVLIIADVSKRRIRAFVEELDIARVKIGQKATVTVDALPGKEVPGEVTEVFSRMGKRSPQSDAPGEYKDIHYREILVDLLESMELPVNLRVRVQIAVADSGASGR